MLRCICVFTHCCGRCHNRATREDLLCDYCRSKNSIRAGIVHSLDYLFLRYAPPESS